MKMVSTIDGLIIALLLILASGCAIQEPKFEVTGPSKRRAILRGETKEALAFNESTALEAERQKHWKTATNAYVQASDLARNSGQIQNAIIYAEKALEMAKRSRMERLQLKAIDRQIKAYRSVGDFEKVRGFIDEGFEILEEIPPNTNARISQESSLYAHLGRDLTERGEYSKAIEAHSQSLELLEEVLDDLLIRKRPGHPKIERKRNKLIDQLINLGTAYRRAENLQKAMKQYQRAFKLIKDWGLKYHNEGKLYEGMGRIYFQKRNFPKALENFNKTLALAERQGRAGSIRNASLRIGAILHKTGRPAEAISYYKKAIQQIESTRSLLQSEEHRRSFFGKKLRAYVGMMRTLLKLGKQEEAFNYNEQARSRAFLDILGSKVQLSRANTALLEEERALQERIAALKARLAGSDEGKKRKGLRRELGEADRAYNAFLAKVRKEDKEQASLMTVEPLTLKNVQELLDPETTLLEYFITKRRTFVWIVEKDKMRFIRLQLEKKELAKLVKTFRDTIYKLGEKEKFTEVSTALYEQLIEPVLPHVTGKELVIVPHEVLHYLPFHALFSPNDRYLIEDYPIYYLPSASLLKFTTAKRRASRGQSLLAFGNPDLGDPRMDLKFAGLEVQQIKRHYSQSIVLVKKEATEEKGKDLSPDHDILHFATHAQLNEFDPMSSALLLVQGGDEDGRLEVKEVFGMNLNANLVVLSACETALGKLSSGDELVGLTRAFIYAGTPSVMASLWRVTDNSTARLMASFYKNLKTMSKVEALRRAQLEFIRGNGEELFVDRGSGLMKRVKTNGERISSPAVISAAHPFFWAAFVLVGDGK